MYYTVYRVTNKVNGKIYIGVHKTNNLDDGYMGSGKYLKRAQEKHGIENFEKEILFVFDNPEEMYAKEAEIVNEDFLSEENTYNIRLGGSGGFEYINKNNLNWFSNRENAKSGRKLCNEILLQKYGEDWRTVISNRGATSLKKHREESKEFDIEHLTKLKNNQIKATEAARNQEAILKRIKSLKEINHQQGERNSQYGTMWITNGIENKKIKIHEEIPSGWKRGRISLKSSQAIML